MNFRGRVRDGVIVLESGISVRDGTDVRVEPVEKTEPSSHLYHYTDDAGFSGIVESGNLRATKIFHLNDSEEFYGGVRLLKDKLEEFKNVESAHPVYGSCVEVLSLIIGDCPGGCPPEKSFNIYVSSFSEEANLLSQWRAYCRRGGVSIGFRRDKLDALAKQQGFVLQRCLYSEEDKERVIDRFLQGLHDDAKSSDAAATREPYTAADHRHWSISDNSIWALLPIIPTLKNRAFFEEKEWRLTSDLQASDKSGELRYRLSNGAVIPYKTVTLNDELWSDSIITVAPGPQRESAKKSVQKLIDWKKLPVSPSQIRTSGIPYRS